MTEMQEYVRETRSGDALTLHFCGWEKCHSGHAFGPAVRTHFLFHFVLSGKGTFEKNGRCWQLEEGQGFLIFPGELTRYEADREFPWEYCWIGFGGSEAETILQSCALTEDEPIHTDRSGFLGQDLLRLAELFGQPGVNSCTLLGRLYLCLGQMAQTQPARRPDAKEHVQRAVDFIQSNYGYEIGVAEIARAVGIDRSYLYRIFRAETGSSPKEYLTAVRLRSAAKLLTASALSVTEISLSCGFHEVSLFDKQFKAAYGCSPLQYRKSKC